MGLNRQRIGRAQALMQKHGIDALMILTHDDYRYFFGEDRFQPRAIIPSQGEPALIAFMGEKNDLERRFGMEVRIFTSVGQQMHDVVTFFKEHGLSEATVGMQLGWFEVPASLYLLFQKLNPGVKVVDSAPVMDELRAVKEPEELERMHQAAAVAQAGLNAALDSLEPGITETEVAGAAEFAMRKLGGTGTATPVFVNAGERSLWLHGTATRRVVEKGDLVIIDLVPEYEGYLANLTRTAVVGRPTAEQIRLYDAYRRAQEAGLAAIRAGATPRQIDDAAEAVVREAGFGSHFVRGMSHGIGLRFEETPAPTIHPNHVGIQLRAGMTVTCGHSVLSVPGVGGVRIEDTVRVTEDGWEYITDFSHELISV